ncbi:EF-P 5-aminopentanol modification-associated protein YfmH [Proteocatella sphenisci]|uniref:EF-P 5-aminopentanol modification-associated protein YfmH n=1 Tax=Proteocatella sphenisci TaxID=181070 RepID=UPI00048C0E0F|nr:pitrilysin family protein [Proteocatella sphenisci]
MKIIKNDNLNESLYHEKLDNNLNVFFIPKKGFTKKYAILASNYGSNDLEFISPFDGSHIKLNEGIAHFLEHKMFEQPDGVDAFSKFSEFGANANAFTNFNMTGYMFSATDNFYESLTHLLDYVQTPYFTDENVEKEKGIIAQEIKMYEDNVDWQLFFNTLRAMYVNHHNNIDIAGTVESIYKISRDELYTCYNSFYSPSNMALFVIGDLEWEDTIKTVKEHVKDDNSFEGEIERINPKEPNNINKKEISQIMEVSIPMFSLGYKDFMKGEIQGKELLHKSQTTDIILDCIFKKGSNLDEYLYMEQLTYEPLSYDYSSHKDYGYTIISGETRHIDKTIEAIKSELERLKKDGLDEADFKRIKKTKIGSFIRYFDSIEGIANSFIGAFFEGINYFDILSSLETITLEDVNKRLREHFVEEMSVISTIKPKENE